MVIFFFSKSFLKINNKSSLIVITSSSISFLIYATELVALLCRTCLIFSYNCIFSISLRSFIKKHCQKIILQCYPPYIQSTIQFYYTTDSFVPLRSFLIIFLCKTFSMFSVTSARNSLNSGISVIPFATASL